MQQVLILNCYYMDIEKMQTDGSTFKSTWGGSPCAIWVVVCHSINSI